MRGELLAAFSLPSAKINNDFLMGIDIEKEVRVPRLIWMIESYLLGYSHEQEINQQHQSRLITK
jgi:hypothetical protein